MSINGSVINFRMYNNATNIKIPNTVVFENTNFTNAFSDMANLISLEIGGGAVNKITNLQRTCYNCINLTGNPVCGPNVMDMSGTYYNCINLTGNPVCGPNVISMDSTYANCRNLTGPGVCGNNVTNMSNAYSAVYLLNSYECGPNVINMCNAYTIYGGSYSEIYWNFGNNWEYDMFQKIQNTYVKNISCGDKVIDMSNTFSGRRFSTNPVVGPNVTNMSYAYCNCIFNNCNSFICGNNVIDMSYAYACLDRGATYNPNVTYPLIGDSVINMSHTFYLRGGTGDIIIGNNVTNMRNCFYGVTSIMNLNHPLPRNISDLSGAFRNCSNLVINTPLVFDNVSNMSYSFYGIKSCCMDIVIRSNNITNMVNAFSCFPTGPLNIYICSNVINPNINDYILQPIEPHHRNVMSYKYAAPLNIYVPANSPILSSILNTPIGSLRYYYNISDIRYESDSQWRYINNAYHYTINAYCDGEVWYPMSNLQGTESDWWISYDSTNNTIYNNAPGKTNEKNDWHSFIHLYPVDNVESYIPSNIR